MTDGSSIELEHFEQVEAAPGTALLRVAAKAALGVSADVAPTLVIDDGARVHRITPIPAPPAPDGLLRVAYSVPFVLLGARPTFALQLSDGGLIRLPPPARSSRLVAPRSEATDELERRLRTEQNRRAQAERQAAEAAEAAAQAVSRLEELDLQQRAARAEHAELVARLGREADALSRLERAVTERDTLLAGRDKDLAELKAALRQARDERAQHQQRAEELDRAIEEMRAEMRRLEEKTTGLAPSWTRCSRWLLDISSGPVSSNANSSRPDMPTKLKDENSRGCSTRPNRTHPRRRVSHQSLSGDSKRLPARGLPCRPNSTRPAKTSSDTARKPIRLVLAIVNPVWV